MGREWQGCNKWEWEDTLCQPCLSHRGSSLLLLHRSRSRCWVRDSSHSSPGCIQILLERSLECCWRLTMLISFTCWRITTLSRARLRKLLLCFKLIKEKPLTRNKLVKSTSVISLYIMLFESSFSSKS